VLIHDLASPLVIQEGQWILPKRKKLSLLALVVANSASTYVFWLPIDGNARSRASTERPNGHISSCSVSFERRRPVDAKSGWTDML
jgi:hypothetical protein